MFHWQPVTIPAESSFDVMSGLGGVPRDHILDGARAQMAVMRKPRSERGAVVESKDLATFGFR